MLSPLLNYASTVGKLSSYPKGAAMTIDTRLDAWFATLDWPTVGPKLLRALEDVDWALSSDKPREARKIVERVFAEIGRTQAELAADKESTV
jgi:hypothetical protein